MGSGEGIFFCQVEAVVDDRGEAVLQVEIGSAKMVHPDTASSQDHIFFALFLPIC